jgi:hypothetical protein
LKDSTNFPVFSRRKTEVLRKDKFLLLFRRAGQSLLKAGSTSQKTATLRNIVSPEQRKPFLPVNKKVLGLAYCYLPLRD